MCALISGGVPEEMKRGSTGKVGITFAETKGMAVLVSVVSENSTKPFWPNRFEDWLAHHSRWQLVSWQGNISHIR